MIIFIFIQLNLFDERILLPRTAKILSFVEINLAFWTVTILSIFLPE